MLDYINSFIRVCTTVFKDFTHSDIKSEKVMFMSREDFHEWEISGIINITGGAHGLAVVSMKTKTATKITSRLTGKEHEYLDDEVVDAVGEIINIIAGNLKKEMEEDFKLIISLPKVIKGKAHFVVWPTDRDRLICVPFNIYDDEIICLSMAMDKN
jgi:chemotaxis protein CheX